MLLQISVKDDKAELFLQLMQELKSTMVDRFDILSSDDIVFDEEELLKRVEEINEKKIKGLSREEVFDGICWGFSS